MSKFTAPNVVPPAKTPQRQLQSTAMRSAVWGATPNYAGFWIRCVAYLIDWTLLTAYCLAIRLLLPWNSMPVASSIVAVVLDCGTIWAYFAGLESSHWQATLGKHLLGLKVTDEDGGPISFWRASARFYGKLLSALPFQAGFIIVGLTKRKQGFHDMLTGTLVVRRRK
jgi:uncharacterized RDD family membrane protein YckC